MGEKILKISHSQGVSIAYILKFNGGHLDFSRWPKINSVHPLYNMKTNFKAAILILADGPKSIVAVH